ncbi:hypothetical protein BYT27DRAFT_7254660 [Phlegmacium glaucopus]|nr:hypothetical protein BYT27DRAFT_7254660 [Phlegmacium glaucopus]
MMDVNKQQQHMTTPAQGRPQHKDDDDDDYNNGIRHNNTKEHKPTQMTTTTKTNKNIDKRVTMVMYNIQ